MTKLKVLKKTSRKNHKTHKKGNKSRKNYLGGSPDAPLAYTGKSNPSQSNPFLAYTGKGGSTCGLSNPVNIPQNINASNPAIPNTGPPLAPTGTPIWNQASAQRGGNCGPQCSMGFMVGGKKHRSGCKCSKCKKMNKKGGNAGIPYPNGLVGSSWTPEVSGWPGVDGISGDRNYLAQNQYHVDPQTAMINVGANPPFIHGGKRKQKGGNTSNLFTQDLINLGRQFQFGLGSAYNALAGYAAPINPMPWRDQMPNAKILNPSMI
jgi:hypothetical protein